MKIGTVSDKTGLGIHTIRYYEKQGLLKKPNKDKSGHRVYESQDVDILNWISCMKGSGMSLNNIRAYTKAFYNNDRSACIAFLKQHLAHLYEQKKSTEHYIDVTESKINKFQKRLT